MLDILAGRRSQRRVSGDFLLNGNPVTLSRLGSRVAYVRRDYRMHPDITVAQTMRFHSLLRKPIRTASSHDKGTRVITNYYVFLLFIPFFFFLTLENVQVHVS